MEGLSQRLSDAIGGVRPANGGSAPVIGVLEGEGVGPEVVPVAIALLDMLVTHSGRRFDIRHGGVIGYPAKALCGSSLSPEVTRFAEEIFEAGGALFCGPGGERFVYQLRRRFDLFCKFTPIRPLPELGSAGVIRPEATSAADIVAVRENSAGIYQGEWSMGIGETGERIAGHCFEYAETTMGRILATAFRLAETRRRRLHVVLKPGGIPSISRLWQDQVALLASRHDVEVREQEVDNAVYQLIADPSQFDVIVSPNLFGDVLADCGSLLLASRGLSYSGNFNALGHGVYQTGHGAARDIAGKGVANPIGQIFSLGMMLRESFDWPEAEQLLKAAVRDTLRKGFRTADICENASRVVGTREFGDHVCRNLRMLLGQSGT